MCYAKERIKNAAEDEDETLSKKEGVQNKKQKKTNEIITLLEHFQDLIDKLWKPAKLILLTRIHMTAYLTGLGYRRFNKTLRG